MELLTLIIFLLFVWSVYFLLFRRRKPINYPQGPFAWPLVGNLLQVPLDPSPHPTFAKWAEKYGPIFSIQLGMTQAILLNNDSKIIREAFNDPNLSGRPDNKVFKAIANGDYGVIGVHGPAWSDQRRFTLKHLRDFGFGTKRMESLILDEAKELIENFKRDEGKPINPRRRFNMAVLNSLWIIVAGARISHNDPHVNYILEDYFNQINEVFMKGVIIFFPKLASIAPERTGFNALLRAIEKANKFFRKLIDEHEKEFIEENEPKDYIDAYLKEIKKTKNPSSSFFGETGYKNLVAIVGDLFTAGGETTSTTLNWAVLFLASFPEIQRKFQAEIDRVIGQRLPSLRDKPLMPYTEAVMMETFRKSSIADLGLFHTALRDTKLRGFDIPKGTYIISNIYSVHHNPRIWGDPENFRPERFLSPDEKHVEKNDAVIPFSVGKRACIGEALARDEFFLFLTSLFQRFIIELDPSQEIPSLIAENSFIQSPKPFSIIVKDRY